MTIAYCCGEEALNPSHDMEAKKLVFLTLLAEDDRGNLVGRLARSWEPSADYREWTYHLRTDVRWHDGVPFTARDIQFTIGLMDAFWDADYGSGAFEKVTVHDDSTVTIRSGHGRRLYQVHMVYYPRHLLQDLDPDPGAGVSDSRHLLQDLDPAAMEQWNFWARPVGNGPYRYVSSVPETMMEFEANPHFYAGPPGIDRVVLKFSAEAGIMDLLSGDVDVSSDVPPADRHALASDGRFDLYYQVWGVTQQAIYWNSGNPLFRDRSVRRALTMAIDRRQLLQALGIPDETPIVDGPITPDQWKERQVPPPVPYNPERARNLLAAAGWRDSDGDGILDRDSQPFRFSMLARTISGENSPGNVSTGVFVQAQLRKFGIQVDLQPLDPGVINSRLETGEFDAVISWFRSYETPWLARLSLGAGEPLGYRNPRLLELIVAAANTWVPAQEDSLYTQIAEILREDVPVTFLHPQVGLTVAHGRLRGLSYPWRVEPVAHMDELWVED